MKLMMLKGVCSAIGLMAALSVSAGEQIDRSIEANPNGGNEVLIKVKVKNSRKHSSRWGNDNEDELIIFVPHQSRINYTAVNADVRLCDIKGGTNAQTVNGEIDAQQLSGRVRFESVNGDINADALKGDVTIETVNGDIR